MDCFTRTRDWQLESFYWIYLQSLGILASIPAAILIVALVGLLLYFLTRCCDRKQRKSKTQTCQNCTLITTTLLCCAAIGLGKSLERSNQRTEKKNIIRHKKCDLRRYFGSRVVIWFIRLFLFFFIRLPQVSTETMTSITVCCRRSGRAEKSKDWCSILRIGYVWLCFADVLYFYQFLYFIFFTFDDTWQF